MTGPTVRLERGMLRVPDPGLWLDPREPMGPEATVFVSHAHSDHTARHARVLLTAGTSRLMRARVPGERTEHVLPFGRTVPGPEAGLPGDTRVTLLPAGHVLGSAMLHLETPAGSLLYTGDFKLRPGLSSEPCEPRPADLLVMETTYGRPEYEFPPTEQVLASVRRFCLEAVDNGEVPVLLGYSLGKAQEIQTALRDAGLPVMADPAVARLNGVYRDLGRDLPPEVPWNPEAARGHVVLAPPGGRVESLRRRLGRCRVAMLTGWALRPGGAFPGRADTAFPLSDHADFPDLLEMVRRVSPRRILTVHGFASDFAATLRRLGFDARALGWDEQLELMLPNPGPAGARAIRVAGAVASDAPAGAGVARGGDVPADGSFAAFAAACAGIRAVPGRRDKTDRLARYLAGVAGEDLPAVVHWFTGRAVAGPDLPAPQVGWAQLRAAVSRVAGVPEARFRSVYLVHSDTGETAAELLAGRGAGGPGPTLAEVRDGFARLAAAGGPGERVRILEGFLAPMPAASARFLVKILTGNLRIGLQEGRMEEGVATAFGVPVEAVRQASQILPDLGRVAQLARDGRLDRARLEPLRPVRPMLASAEPSGAAVLARAAGWDPAGPAGPLWVEDKFDGIRGQLHRAGSRVALFSRDLRALTGAFPELEDAARTLASDVILDGEVVAWDGDRPRPFADLQTRIGRRGRDLFLAREVPVRFLVFDLLWCDGTGLLERPLSERRARLEALAGSGFPAAFLLAPVLRVPAGADVDRLCAAARARGHEGVLVKDPGSAYLPGRRGVSWLKYKPARATLDCVVVAAEYGHGRRHGVLSDYTFAVRDEADGSLLPIGKAYTGLTDAEIADLTDHFLARVRRRRGRRIEVEPDVVLEVAFDAIRPSARHASGLALRFPRIVRRRDDKTPAGIDTLATARRLASDGAAEPV